MLGQLGCGDYSLRVVTRGNLGVVWEEIPFTSLDYGRVLDDTSQATAQIDGLVQGCQARADLAKTVTMEHELAIYRDTSGKGGGSLVWIGPLTERKATGTRAVLNGRDRSYWWDVRFLHLNYAVTADCAVIFQEYFNDAMSPSPVAGFTCTVTPTGISATRGIAALDHKPSGPEMRELSAIGIDWTVIGPACVGGGKTIPTAQLPVITDEHIIGDPDILDSGLIKVNRQIITGGSPVDPVTGQTIDGPSIFGEADDVTLQARDGLIEENTQDDQALDVGSATAGAASSLALNSNGGAIVSSVRLGQNAPMTFDQLIPGALIQIQLTYPAIPVSGTYRIAAVDVTLDPSAGEQITITVQPIGTT